MTAPCSAAWQDHSLPYHDGLHVCAACTQLPAGRVDAGNRVGGGGAARPEPCKHERVEDGALWRWCLDCETKLAPLELVTQECGPFWAHEDCDDPGCTCHCHGERVYARKPGGSGS